MRELIDILREQRHLDSSGYKALLECDDEGVVKGIIRVSGTEVVKLYVEPQFQNSGIGAELLEFAVKEFGADNLWALEYNTRGIAFYERHGFQLTGEKMIEDEWVPLVKLALGKEA